jgi:D-alanyl-D-alanine endopeptidase (penicillin-binding protein 7)
MNRKAGALGMTSTHFENPAGLSKNNVSTAHDLAKMVDAAYRYPLIRQYSTDADYVVDTGRGVLKYRSTNILLRDPSWNIDVQKTGFINESGICLVMRVTIDGRPITMVLLDSSGKHSDFVDAARLRAMVTAGATRVTTAGVVGGS